MEQIEIELNNLIIYLTLNRAPLTSIKTGHRCFYFSQNRVADKEKSLAFDNLVRHLRKNMTTLFRKATSSTPKNSTEVGRTQQQTVLDETILLLDKLYQAYGLTSHGDDDKYSFIDEKQKLAISKSQKSYGSIKELEPIPLLPRKSKTNPRKSTAESLLNKINNKIQNLIANLVAFEKEDKANQLLKK